MKTIEIISQDVFDKIRSRFSNLEMGDETGAITMDPREARFFDFDFAIEENNLGRVSISINELGTLKVFYGQSLLENSDSAYKKYWYDFLREMRNFAMRRLLRFDTRDITKSNLNKDDFQYLAAKGPKDETNMNESKFQGSKKTSVRQLQKTKLIAKHHKNIEDESFGARSRANNIKALYVENEEGERFKYPFIHVAGAKAMQMHCAHGGKPYDDKGKAIIGMSEQIAQLSAFKRHMGGHDEMNQEVNNIAERASAKLESLRSQVNNLGKQHHYQEWSECWQPVSTMQGMAEMDEATMEDYKSKFTVSSFKEDLAQYFPLIHSIMQETGEIDLEDLVHENSNELDKTKTPQTKKSNIGFEQFENWANRVEEGYLEPDTIMALKDMLDSGDLDVVGLDATTSIEALQGIGVIKDEDDDLPQALKALARTNPDSDPTDTILGWLAKDDPEAAAELGYEPPEGEESDTPPPQPGTDLPPPEMGDGGDQEPTNADIDPEGGEEKTKEPTVRDLAEWLMGHYNKDYKEEGFASPWRKGPTELEIMANKEFGEGYGHIVGRMVSDMDDSPLNKVTRKHEIRNKEMEEEQHGIFGPVHGDGAEKPSGGGKMGWRETDEGTPPPNLKARADAAFADLEGPTSSTTTPTSSASELDSMTSSDAALSAQNKGQQVLSKGVSVSSMPKVDQDQYRQNKAADQKYLSKERVTTLAPNEGIDRIRQLAGLAK
jgi:hypothetical protein